MKTSSLLTALTAAFVLANAPDADACKCIPPTVSSSYQNATDVVRAQIVYGATVGNDRWHLARVLGTFKGCAKPNSWIYVRTGSSSAACGLTLPNGAQYLLNGSADTSFAWAIPVINVNSCGYNRPISQLTKHDRRFLTTRYNCCGKTCACTNGKAPVNCFADPCSVAGCPSGECQSNDCGGCKAEFFDESGYQMCLPCQANNDCAWGQACSEGLCVATCTSNEDCNKGNWCRPTQGDFGSGELGAGACTPYAGEGEYCGGFVPYWMVSACAPGLICTDTPPWIADAPGICRQPCKSFEDCAENEYCGSGDVCRDDGACKTQKDCMTDGNSYITVKCLGYSVCLEDKCDYKCGSPLCNNVEGVDFGFCDMFLGWTNVGGKCQAVSGCDGEGFNFYETEAACLEACGWTPVDTCADLSEVDFGLCKAILGYGVVGGKCQMISGCGNQGYPLFGSQEECDKQCGAAGPTCEDIGKMDFGDCEMVLGVAVVGGVCQTVSGCSDMGVEFFADVNQCQKACTVSIQPK